GHHDYPLVAALYGGHIRVAELLFQHGANVDPGTTKGRTPLHRAIEWPNNLAIGAVQFLLKHGANVNFRNVHGVTPLHLVAKLTFSRHCGEDNGADLAQLLLRHGAEVNSRDRFDSTPLHDASHVLDLEVARVLLDNGADVNAVNDQGQHPFHQVVESYSSKARVGVARLLVERGADVNAPYNGYLDNHIHIQPKDRFGAAQLLVERGAIVNARNKYQETPFDLASFSLKPKLVRILPDRGADFHAMGVWERIPIGRLFESKDYHQDCFDVVQLLLDRGADANIRIGGDTLLHMASRSMNLKLVQVLLDHGANVDARDNWGGTQFRRVLRNKDYNDEDNFGIAQVLTERGADVNKGGKLYETPLHQASRLVLLEVAWLLLEHGADLSAANKEGKIPFQVAQESIRKEMKKWPSDNSIGRSRRAKCVALMGLLYRY
ncbi:ankyrin repeat-containing domain protein, partial [Lactarius akahatsu]